MAREVRLSHGNEPPEELDYPVDRERAAEAMSDVTLLLADDIISELHNTLPREAVGEPYQSEGEG